MAQSRAKHASLPMSMLTLLVLLALLAVAISAVILLRVRLRFSLRWLLMVVAMVAVVLGAARWWQTYGRARLERIDPASAEAAALRPDPVIIERDGVFVARYRPRHRSITQLVDLPEVDEARASVGDEATTSFGITCYSDMQLADYESSSRAQLEAVLATVRRADVLQPESDESVIFGVVTSRNGRPITGASVDLLGPFQAVNQFRTRTDGTFLMPLTAPAGRGYYLRIRYGEHEAVLTPSFRYDGPGTELGLRVTVD